MALEVGSRLGHYSVTALIGEGGMGQVYQATDTKLNRQVALKILPEAFATDPDRLARFQREAHVLASLNHPNIAAIHGLEESDDTRALVLELVEGPTLEDRIKQGPIPVDEALPIAKQIAEALEAAHEAGVIHRDLKPANIKVRDDGTVKVLDFGLAKALDTAPEGDPSQSPTLTAAATQMGVIMGTAAYMSPEQARGKPVDKRADIWSFGLVLFEMLTGQRVFEGNTVPETLAKVLETEPDWQALPKTIPATVLDLLRRCLERESWQRLRDIGDARIETMRLLTGSGGVTTAAAAAGTRPATPKLIPSVAGATILAAVVTGLAVWSVTRVDGPTPVPIRRYAINIGPTAPLQPEGLSAQPVLSPDGVYLAYVADHGDTSQLFVRPLDQLEALPIPGTEGAINPFFSPDGEWIGFFADDELKKVSIRGGAPQTLCAAPRHRGGTWVTDDTIIFAAPNRESVGEGLFRVAAAGGEPESLTMPDVTRGERIHRWPAILPGRAAILFTVFTTTRWNTDSNDAQIAVLSLETGEYHALAETGTSPRYVPTGHLVFGRHGALWAAPFDLDQLETTGPAVPIREQVEMDAPRGTVPFTFSRDGLLIYASGGEVGAQETSQLVWVDRLGNEEPLPLDPRPGYFEPRLSPDGGRLAVRFFDETQGTFDLGVFDLERGTFTRLTTAGSYNENPIWTPDGERIIFGSNRTGTFDVYWTPADGSGPAERLTTSDHDLSPHGLSPDGQTVAVWSSIGGLSDIALLSMEGAQIEPLLEAQAVRGISPTFSPDGRWLAYASSESGRAEIYVQPFPDEDRRSLISNSGGQEPAWAADGRGIFYRVEDRMMAVQVEAEPVFTPGRPRELFRWSQELIENDLTMAVLPRAYDVAADGRFVMVKPVVEGLEDLNRRPTALIAVEGWFEELERLVPTN